MKRIPDIHFTRSVCLKSILCLMGKKSVLMIQNIPRTMSINPGRISHLMERMIREILDILITNLISYLTFLTSKKNQRTRNLRRVTRINQRRYQRR